MGELLATLLRSAPVGRSQAKRIRSRPRRERHGQVLAPKASRHLRVRRPVRVVPHVRRQAEQQAVARVLSSSMNE